MNKIPLMLSPAVQNAMAKKKPVLALESTVITHGLPYPTNFQTLESLEQLARDHGAEPATICLIKGNCHIGLDKISKAALKDEFLHRSNDLLKLSMRDLPLAIAQAMSGGTTVSATMLLAYKAGIRIFATGGIGGVHRDWNQHPDISMDLKALSEIPVCVVSAGCKAILDISATLEYLESMAVPVLGWQTELFPTFYSRSSDYKVDCMLDAQTFNHFLAQHLALTDHKRGVLIVNPIPIEDEIPSSRIEPFIAQAISAANQNGISGKALTPFLLDHLASLTQGESVKANLALLRNNVKLGAELAKNIQGVVR